MRLKSVKLTHFRGYRVTTVIPIDEAMPGIVDCNHYGKSTPVEALAIFFEIEGARLEKSENGFSLAKGAGQFETACEFDNQHAALVQAEASWVPSGC